MKRTGVLVYITHLGFAGRIPFTKGQLVNSLDPIQLKHFFTSAMQESYWEGQPQTLEEGQDTVAVLAGLLEPLEWNEPFCHGLSHMLCKLPIVEVKAIPVQFEDYHLEICAGLLHRQALASSLFKPQQFLDNVSNSKTLKARLKIMLLAYVSGLMNAKKEDQRQTKKNKTSGRGKSSLANRILQRIKGIGS
ncbi:MAG: hypothetical protein Q9M09_06480 [Mariprofundaceae bacterium]|nr:hypothetical protein [Mariprofundaceae bacterium]